MRNAGLEETQAGIKIAGRNINNLRYQEHKLSGSLLARQKTEETLALKAWVYYPQQENHTGFLETCETGAPRPRPGIGGEGKGLFPHR